MKLNLNRKLIIENLGCVCSTRYAPDGFPRYSMNGEYKYRNFTLNDDEL
jgi:hypothetical protein